MERPSTGTAAGKLLGRVGVTTLAVVAVAAVTLLVARWVGDANSQPLAIPSPSPEPTPLTPAEISALLAPSLVSVTAERAPGEVAAESLGSGVVVSDDGTVLTALHVVDGAASVVITFADGTKALADITAADPDNDIAALAPRQLPSLVVPAIVGSSQALAVGSDVVVLGNPLGLTASTSSGVVSGLDRRAPESVGLDAEGLIQFDAAVNPGSSGGPLVDTSGAMVGIVVGLVNPTNDRTFIGIGLAVPIGTALGGAGSPRR